MNKQKDAKKELVEKTVQQAKLAWDKSVDASGRAMSWFEKVSSHPDDKPDQPALPGVIEAEIRATTHMFLIMAAVLVLVFGLWSSVCRLDIMSVSNGEVVPSGNIKKVQHLEGGIVKKILVREGDEVTKDQPLIEMESTASESAVNELNIRNASLRINIARLMAELADAKSIKAEEDILLSHSNLVEQADGLFRANREQLRNLLSSQDKLITQRKRSYQELEARVKNEKARMQLLKEQVSISDELLKDELTSRYQHLDLLKQANVLEGSIEENGIALQRAESALAEQETKKAALISTYKKEVQGELEQNRRSFDELAERMRKFNDNLERAVLRAPVDGIVKTLYVVTEGGVVRPGATLLDIVPGDDQLIIEAKLPPLDIGYVKLGQTALLRLASADAFKYGVLEGEVVAISPDTHVSPGGPPYYKVTIVTDKTYFGSRKMRYILSPGLLLQVSIQTGSRTVLQYIFSPLMSGSRQAMTER